jgi:hypothetical protein
MALPSFIRATGQAGVYEIEGIGEMIRLVEYKVGGVKDAVVLQAGALTPGKRLYLFRDVTGKNKQFNTFENNAGKLPAHTDLIINRIGCVLAQANGNVLATLNDTMKLSYAGVLEVFVNKDRQIAEGALYEFPSGYGIAGNTTETTSSVLTNGVPSLAAAPQLLVAQPVKPEDSVSGYIEFPDNDGVLTTVSDMPTVENRTVFIVHLDGLIKRPQGR